MNSRTLLLLATTLVPMLGLRAQDPTSTPPPPILAPTGNMKWTITIQSQTPPAPGTYEPSVLEYVHAGDWTRMVGTFGPSGKATWWFSHGYQLSPNEHLLRYKVPLSRAIVVIRQYSGKDALLPAPYDTSGFFGIEHIQPADDRGTIPYQGVACRYYSNHAAAGASDGTSVAGGYEAWFDLKTGLPKAYRSEGKTYTFELPQASPEELQVPAEYKEALRRFLLTAGPHP